MSTEARNLAEGRVAGQKPSLAAGRYPSILVVFDWEATIMRLPGKVAMKYRRFMIAVEADQDCVQIRIPTNGLTPEEVNGLVSWLRVEAIVCHSRLTPQSAWQLAEEIKSDWWRANEQRFLPPGSE